MLIGLVPVLLWLVVRVPERAVGPGLADPAPAVAERSPAIRIEGREVPLPPGAWRVLARHVTDGQEKPAELPSLVLMRLNGREVDAAVLVQVNRLGQRVSWGVPSACLQEEFSPRRVLYVSDHDGACAYAAFVDGTGALTGVAIDPAWRRAMREAVDHGWNVPMTWLSVTFRVTDPEDAMQIRYLFHPWPVSQTDPPVSAAWRRIQADRLGLWMEVAQPKIAAAFRGRLGSWAEATLPDPEATTLPADTGEAEDGSMTASARAALARLVSYRMVTALTDFGVLWFYLGNAATASMLAGFRVMGQSAASFTHEFLWSMIAPPIPRHDLPGVGLERPLPR